MQEVLLTPLRFGLKSWRFSSKSRTDIKAQFHVMASALSKEIGMMEAQLNRCKETAREAIYLCEESHSLKVLLSRKSSDKTREPPRIAYSRGTISCLGYCFPDCLCCHSEVDKMANHREMENNGNKCNQEIIELFISRKKVVALMKLNLTKSNKGTSSMYDAWLHLDNFHLIRF
ncbi:uncharacterized protein LOC122071329 isoform X2 [Macadamia integrifolia]|nr:uncharacterized protein LOC122071329 isoform X2 [Macadamia integrifolia]